MCKFRRYLRKYQADSAHRFLTARPAMPCLARYFYLPEDFGCSFFVPAQFFLPKGKYFL
jgi:hypothetical protein